MRFYRAVRKDHFCEEHRLGRHTSISSRTAFPADQYMTANFSRKAKQKPSYKGFVASKYLSEINTTMSKGAYVKFYAELLFNTCIKSNFTQIYYHISKCASSNILIQHKSESLITGRKAIVDTCFYHFCVSLWSLAIKIIGLFTNFLRKSQRRSWYLRTFFRHVLIVFTFQLPMLDVARAADQMTDRFGNIFKIESYPGVANKYISINGISTSSTAKSVRSIKSFKHVDLIAIEDYVLGDSDCRIILLASAAKNVYFTNDLSGEIICKFFKQGDEGYTTSSYSGADKFYPIDIFSDIGTDTRFPNPFLSIEDWFGLLRELYSLYIVADRCEQNEPKGEMKSRVMGIAKMLESNFKKTSGDFDNVSRYFFEKTANSIDQQIKEGLSDASSICKANLQQISNFFETKFVEIPNESTLTQKKPW